MNGITSTRKKMDDLQKSKSNISYQGGISEISLRPSNDMVELLKAKPISLQVQEHGEERILMEIRISVEKCATGLNLSVDDEQVAILCEDIMEVYSHDSIEDVQICLKKARQGRYGFGFNKRGVITMELVREWMARHLEEKAQERERIIHNRKQQEEDQTEYASSEEAQEAINKIKEIIKKSAVPKKDSAHKPAVKFENITALQKLERENQKTIDSFNRCMKKMENGEELSEVEIYFLRAWNVKI